MSEDTNFTQYDSPNIIIVPTMSCDNPPRISDAENKTSKDDTSSDNTSKSIPILIQRTTTNSKSCMDNADKNVKHMIWAKNYLPSIGLSYDKSVLNQRGGMDSSQNNTNMFFTRVSVSRMDAQQPNMNYIDFNNQSLENNAGFVNNINSQTTQIGGKVPSTSYPGAYVNENNNYSYYYNQPPNNYTAYYNPTPTTVNVNLPTTYLNTFSQPSHDIGINASPMATYYDPNASLTNQNNRTAYSNVNNENTPTANDFAKTTIKSATAPTHLVDENLTTSCCGKVNKCTKFPITSNQSNDVRCGQTDQESATNSIVKKKCCNCMCSKVNSEEKNYRQELKSSVQAHEKAFRDFSIKMDRPPEQKKQIICKETSSKDTSTKLKPSKKSKRKKNITKRQKSSVQENEKAFQIFLQKFKIEQELALRKLEKTNLSSKKTFSKDTSSSNVQATTYSEKDKKYRNLKEQEEKRPKFIKTKYVDEQEPQYQPKVKNSSSEDLPNKSTNLSTIGYLENDKTKTYKFPKEEEKHPKFIKTKHVDEQEHPKFIKTKYVDKQEPEYKPIKKARIDINYDNTKCSTRNSDSTYFKLKRSRDDSESSERIIRRGDNSYKTCNSKTDEVKYKRTEDRREIRKITPVKSIIKISEKHEKINKSPRCRILKNEDLRDTLSRKLQKNPSKLKNKEREHEIPKRKSSEDSNDSLVVTVNNKLSENKDDPKNSKGKQKSKNASCKKLNLVINIVYKEPGSRSRSESDKSDSDDHSPQTNVDLSFLDDFNVDEIVASLNKTEKIVTRQISQNKEPYVTNSEQEQNKLDTSNALTQRKNTECSEAKKILQKEDVLNNLLSKEAGLLDNLRTIHQEIQSEKKNSTTSSDDDIIFREKTDETDQKELIRILEDTTDDALGLIETQINIATNSLFPTPHLQEKVLNVLTIIDLSNDDSADSNEIKLSKQKTLSKESLDDDVYIVEDPKKDHETIDLTTDENSNNQNTKKSFNSSNAVAKVQQQDKAVINKSGVKKNYRKDPVANKELSMKNVTKQKPRKNNITTKIVNAIKDSIVSMQINESLNKAVDSLEKYPVKQFPTTEINNTKEAVLDYTYRVKDKEIANIQDATPNNQSDICHNDKDMECDNSVSETLTEDLSNEPQIINGTTIVSKSITCSNMENEKNKIKDDKIIELATNKRDTIKNKILSGVEKVEESTKSLPMPETQAEVTPDKTSKYINEHRETKTLTEGANITQTEQNASVTISKNFTSSNEQNEKDRNDKIMKSQMNNSEIKVGNDKIVESQISKSKVEVNVDKKIKPKDVTLSKAQTDIPKTEVSTTKSVPSTSGSKEKLNVDENMLQSEDVKSKAQTDISKTEHSTTKSMPATSGSKEKLNVDENMLQSEDVKSKAQTDISKTEHSTTKSMPATSGSKEKLNVDENMLQSEDVKSKAQTDISKTEHSTTKSMPATSGTKGKLNVDEDILKSEDVKSKAQTDISKTEASTTKTMPSTSDTKEKLNVDENKLKSEDIKSKAQTDTQKTEANSTKAMLLTSGTKVNSSLPTVKKENTCFNADVKTKQGNKKLTVLPHHNMIQIPIIVERLEQEMFNIFKQRYSVIGLIHAGAYSKVFHCRSKGQNYAVKSLNRWSSTEQHFYKEAEKNDMLFSMQRSTTRDSHGCVYLINSFSIKGHMCFMMDYYPKNLRQALKDNGKPLHINVVQHLARQLVSAVMMLKSHNVVHLDINPRHILLNLKNNNLKLCGFDEARYVNQIPRNPNLGSINYRPPEVIVGYKLGFDIDVWATGLVLYEMATDIKLFPGTHNNGILFKQMCTLGALPIEMIHRSHYSHEHFTGSSFKWVSGKNFDKFNLITKFFRSKRLETTIMKTYNDNWRNTASELELQSDNDKLLNLTALLREMLVVNPCDRIPIQFVNGSAFITN